MGRSPRRTCPVFNAASHPLWGPVWVGRGVLGPQPGAVAPNLGVVIWSDQHRHSNSGFPPDGGIPEQRHFYVFYVGVWMCVGHGRTHGVGVFFTSGSGRDRVCTDEPEPSLLRIVWPNDPIYLKCIEYVCLYSLVRLEETLRSLF